MIVENQLINTLLYIGGVWIVVLMLNAGLMLLNLGVGLFNRYKFSIIPIGVFTLSIVMAFAIPPKGMGCLLLLIFQVIQLLIQFVYLTIIVQRIRHDSAISFVKNAYNTTILSSCTIIVIILNALLF